MSVNRRADAHGSRKAPVNLPVLAAGSREVPVNRRVLAAGSRHVSFRRRAFAAASRGVSVIANPDVDHIWVQIPSFETARQLGKRAHAAFFVIASCA